MNFADIKLACVDCGADFVFTASEQFYFVTKHFANLPRHCKKCKAKRDRFFRRPVRPVLHETHTTCAECGVETTVPFIPVARNNSIRLQMRRFLTVKTGEAVEHGQ